MKTKIKENKRTHVVYKVNCLDCDGCYIGQTKQYIEDRMKAHEYSLKQKNKDLTALKKHAHENGHRFDFKNVEVLKKEVGEKRRLIHEIIQIKKHKKSVNDRRDTENFSCIYDNLISR